MRVGAGAESWPTAAGALTAARVASGCRARAPTARAAARPHGTARSRWPPYPGGTYYPEWLLERRPRAARALTTVVATSYLKVREGGRTVNVHALIATGVIGALWPLPGARTGLAASVH